MSQSAVLIGISLIIATSMSGAQEIPANPLLELRERASSAHLLPIIAEHRGQLGKEEKKSNRKDSYGDPLPDHAVARLGTTRLCHITGRFRHPLIWLAFSNDDKTVISVAGSICIWDRKTGQLLHELELAHRPARLVQGPGRVVFSAQGPSLAQGTVCYFWRKPNDVPIQREFSKNNRGPDAIAMSPDEKTFALGFPGEIQLRDWTSGKIIHRFGRENELYRRILFTPDGKTLIAGGSLEFKKLPRTLVRFWDTKSGKEIRSIQTNDTGSIDSTYMDISPDGKTLATGGQYLRLWDVASGKEMKKPGKYGLTAFCPDGKIAGGGQHSIHFFDPPSGKELGKIPLPMINNRIAFSPDRKTMALGHKGSIRFIDLASKRDVTPVSGHQDRVLALDFLPGGKSLVSVSPDSVRIWDVTAAKGKMILAGDKLGFTAMAVSPDGKILAAEQERELLLWDIDKNRAIEKFETGTQNGLAFSPDGKILTSDLWEVRFSKEGRKFHRLNFGSGGYNVVYSPDGMTLAKGGPVNSATYFWNKAGEQVKSNWQVYINQYAFSPLGKSLAGGSRTTLEVNLYERATGKKRLKYMDKSGVLALAFSPDGKILAAAPANDESCILLETDTGKEIAHLKGHSSLILSLAFAPDGTKLATGSIDGTILIWDLAQFVPKRPGEVNLQAKELESLWAHLAGDDAICAFQAILKLARAPKQTVPFLKERFRQNLTPPLRIIRALEVLEFIATPEARQVVHSLSQGPVDAPPTQEAKAALIRMSKQMEIQP